MIIENKNSNSVRPSGSARKSASFSVSLAKMAMKLMPSPVPNADDLSLNEIFRHERYLNAPESERAAIRRASSQFRFEEEERKPFFLTYFSDYNATDPDSSRTVGFQDHLKGKDVLDFGCFTGGRGVRWATDYGIKKILGTDINEIYIQAASEFAESKNLNHDYRKLNADGSMPFDSESVDTVVTFDVLEHVNDVRASMLECLRVLKPNGIMFVVFPSYYNPLEAHLDLVTRTPALQWFFPSDALTRAYSDILDETDAQWYKPTGDIQRWEKLPTLNGSTSRTFNEILKALPVRIKHTTRTPILTTGKSYPSIRRFFIRPTLNTFLRTGLVDDLLLDRIALVLEKC
jgi:2-polyprenyl-3-methyl-5-hydroxy-6-metoxy-1,4-benzoquinol methylase